MARQTKVYVFITAVLVGWIAFIVALSITTGRPKDKDWRWVAIEKVRALEITCLPYKGLAMIRATSSGQVEYVCGDGKSGVMEIRANR